ncbi:MAG: hypothetical protein R3F11_12280 [Verrucomicrobiales bacterium]
MKPTPTSSPPRFRSPPRPGGGPGRNVLFLISDDGTIRWGATGIRLPRPRTSTGWRAAPVSSTPIANTRQCGPSRNRCSPAYPNSTGILQNGQIRQTIPSQLSMPQAFRLEGYFAARIGKLYHYNVPKLVGNGHDDPGSWELELNPAGCDRLEEEPEIFSPCDLGNSAAP